MKIRGVFLLAILLTATACFADDSAIEAIKKLPWWVQALLGGGGIVGTVITTFLSKIIPGFGHILTIFKKTMKAITVIKPILADKYVIDKYGDVLADYNAIVDETEEALNDVKIVKTRDFLEKYKIKTIDHSKVMAAIKLSPVIAALEETIDKKEGI
jgi:hypothetical protein